MAEPGHLGVSEWAQIISGAIVSGVSGAAAWFRGSKKSIFERISRVEDAMNGRFGELERTTHTHDTDIAVMKTIQVNHLERLEMIQETARDTNAKVDGLQKTLLDVLSAVKQRRT